jgi:hypothetical protein
MPRSGKFITRHRQLHAMRTAEAVSRARAATPEPGRSAPPKASPSSAHRLAHSSGPAGPAPLANGHAPPPWPAAEPKPEAQVGLGFILG